MTIKSAFEFVTTTGMYQSMKKLRATPDRVALTIITVDMIAMMVTFPSALAVRLSAQPVSVFDEVYGKDNAVVISEGVMLLSSSSMDETVYKSVQTWTNDYSVTVRDVYANHTRVDEMPVTVISDLSLSDNQVAVTDGVNETVTAEGDLLALSGAVGEHETIAAHAMGNKWLDCQAIIYVGHGVMEGLTPG